MQKTTTAKIVGRVVFTVFTVLLVGVIAASFVPMVFGLIPCSIGTDEMEPAVNKGSYVVVKSVEFSEITVSDILLFEAPKTGERFIRRVSDIYSDEKQLVTSGDADGALDPMTTAYSCVLGKVILVVPFVGYLSLFAESLIGKAIILLVFVIWISVEIEIFRSEKRRVNPNE
ncbi:MAG: signal peptidase I [Clostridia bacterium]|nr:signal peptidase I [Clostridia bacterium]